MSQVRIALVGKKAVGKTFVAFDLLKRYGFRRMPIHGGIDRMIRFMYGYAKYKRPTWFRRYEMYDALYKVDPNIHVNHLLDRLKTATMNVVVEDLRYMNEVETLAKNGFLIVRVTTDESVRKGRIEGLRFASSGTVILQEYFNQDSTTSYKADYTITNTTREATRRSIDQLMSELNIPLRN